MDKAAVAVLLVSAVVLAGCAGNQGGDSQDGGSGQAPVSCDEVQGETHTVTYSSSGFSPQQLTVQRCDTVTWESQGAEMEVASDRHPTHTEYDGTSRTQHCPGGDTFDQCGSRSSYSFTFEKTGQWGYHNHVRAAHGGTVTVEPR